MIDLEKKITQAEYEANEAAITAAIAAKDAAFIRQELGMTDWTEYYRTEKMGIVAHCEPTKAFWNQWRRDRIQITKRLLQPTRDSNGWMVECYDCELSELLINR